jgi:carbamoyltransferase
MIKDSSVQIIIDGFGDDNIAWTVFRDDKIVDVGSLDNCGSIGLNMSSVGYNFGMTDCHGLDIAGKLMGLQSYGNIDDGFKRVIEQYGIRNANDIFDYSKWIDYKQDKLLADLTKLDWITTIHDHIGDKLVEFFSEFVSENEVILYAGGVAQNVIWNTKLKQKFKNLIIPPHCADDGLSLGALEFLRRKHNIKPFNINNFPYCQSDELPLDEPTEEVYDITAKLLSNGKIVAWYQGNGEIGPRALGNRSILMDPRIVNGKDKINSVKKREFYRPFGASVLSHLKHECFIDLCDNPYMLYVAQVKSNMFPSITHVDGTCRAQTVDNTPFAKLLTKFYELTKCPVLLNTSLNIAGKPIAGFREDALTLFKTSNIDALVIGNHVYIKE